LNSIFADYSDEWFIPFVGDDVVAKCISYLKNKAAFDTEKGANLGLKCARMRLAAGLARTRWGSAQAPPDHLAAIGGGVPTSKGREGKKWEKGRKGMGRGREGGKERGGT